MEKSDIMAHWLRSCWIPGDVLLDSHNSPAREVETRAPRHKKMKPCAQAPVGQGLSLDLHLSGPQESPGLPSTFSRWSKRKRTPGLGRLSPF